MKRTALMLTLVVLITKSNAQKFESNFLGSDFMQYKGLFLRLRDDYRNYRSYKGDFFHPMDEKNISNGIIVIQPDDSWKDRIFLVLDIVDKKGQTFSGFADLLNEPYLTLIDTATREIIYFQYDKDFEHSFPFVTSKIVLDKVKLGSEIEREVDDFTGKINLNSPLAFDNEICSMTIFKTIANGKSSYSLFLRTIGQTVNINKTGAIVLFSDGTKWTKPAKIDVEAQSNGFEYTTFIALTTTDLTTFATKKVKKFRLYVYDQEVSNYESEKFKVYVSCIMSMK